jgi:uncharacterized protein YjbI with pentapeptide repeats
MVKYKQMTTVRLALNKEVPDMANREHLDLLKQGVNAWNQWRKEYPNIQPDLSEAHFPLADFSGINLSQTNLMKADMRGLQDLSHISAVKIMNMEPEEAENAIKFDRRKHKCVCVQLGGADLSDADLSAADLWLADLSNADLSGADLSETNLTDTLLNGTNLSRANLSKTRLWDIDLRETNLSGANLSGADLRRKDLSGMNLSGVNLSGADLRETNLSGANLSEADLSGAKLHATNLYAAVLHGTRFIGTDLTEIELDGRNLSKADLSKTDLSRKDLSGANLTEANLTEANLTEANFGETNLSRADLIRAILVRTDLRNAILTGCRVYGIAAWDLQLEGAKQLNLVITSESQPTITVDNLEVAQFIYLLLNNKKIRDVIDTITSKVVLILGRFTIERKTILDALRDELRKHNYSPVLFDFEKPVSRDLTETVNTLAHLARFIIVDLTDPSSAPHEVAMVIPHTVVPVQPLLSREPLLVDGKVVERREYAMFEDLRRRYHWVLPTFPAC